MQTFVLIRLMFDAAMYFFYFIFSIIPLLEPEYVANKVIEAVLTDQKVLMIPRLMYIVYALKGSVAK